MQAVDAPAVTDLGVLTISLPGIISLCFLHIFYHRIGLRHKTFQIYYAMHAYSCDCITQYSSPFSNYPIPSLTHTCKDMLANNEECNRNIFLLNNVKHILLFLCWDHHQSVR